MSAPVLQVERLEVSFRSRHKRAPKQAVAGLSFDVHAGQTVALVGESGCGKSTTALALMGLSGGDVRAGSMRFKDVDLQGLSERHWRAIRGAGIGFIPQNPLAALNPVRKIGRQITETLTLHQGLRKNAARAEALVLLKAVGIAEPSRRFEHYPHELSGGMRQRVLIAIALAGKPDLLIADEPTTALDVTTQAQILALLADVQRRTGMSLLLITHDLNVVSQVAERVLVMYAGDKIEEQSAETLLSEPRHPYTKALLAARPTPADAGKRLSEIAQAPRGSATADIGCAFAPRCAIARSACGLETPVWQASGESGVRCSYCEPVSKVMNKEPYVA